MGAWSSNLFGNDTTCDVRDSYIALLQDGNSNREAYTKLLETFRELIGDQDEPLFWFALADTQWRYGRLLPEVKEKAFYWMGQDGGTELWEESPSGSAGWRKVLLKLREKLESPMPDEKKIRKPPELNQNPWNIYDIYAFQFHSKKSMEAGYYGKYILLQKIGEDGEWYKPTAMRIQVLDRIFDTLPTIDDIKGLRILPLDLPSRADINNEDIWGVMTGIQMNCCVTMYKAHAYPVKCLVYIGNHQGPANKQLSRHELAWENLDDSLMFYHGLWQGVEYEAVGEGLYHYTPLPSI